MKPAIAVLLAVPALALAQVAEPQPDELLQIAFPKWKDEEGGRVQSIQTSAATRCWDARQGKKRNVIVVPRQAVRVAPDRIVLLVTLTPAGDGGVPQIAHGTPAGLAAYTFKPGKDGWKLAKRQEPFDLQGYEGRAQLGVLPLSPTKQGLHVTWGSCWQGHCVDLFALYSIGPDGVKPKPLLLQKIKGDNVYSRPDCVDRLAGVVQGLQPADPAYADDKVAPGRCYAIEGRWEVASAGALVLRFSGAMSKGGKEGNAPAQRIDQAMKFEFRGGRYVPVSGSNPVPDA
ncbi:hypothetical protein SAMN05518865_1062 [Duganella sp. CF458]|uniref:hypothetical protein n=1 Tax=Duganella sp. CF458 TaxID=1884368 RepID=UPI0008E7A7F2|nr:hypothetical protein [Duganella sp. CF458]SFF91070.1 hypothetical protein SAMN05518865_1062 [Duganella sp. CF458]